MTIAFLKWYLKMNSEVQTAIHISFQVSFKASEFKSKYTKSNFCTSPLNAVSMNRNSVRIHIWNNQIKRPYGQSLD